VGDQLILAILQSRVTSSRLPRKVLKEILGHSMLWHEIERIKRSKKLDQIVLATSNEKSDDPIEAVAQETEIKCFRGDLEDVLLRFYSAAVEYRPEWVVRLTGDCPLIDPNIIDQVISFCIESNYDYASNTLEPTYPDGLDVEVFKFSTLEKAHLEAKLLSERQHVTPFIYKHPELFKLGSFKGKVDYSALRWTVDEPSDFNFVNSVYEEVYSTNPMFGFNDILAVLNRRPELAGLNSRISRNEGYLKSLIEEKSKG
jgi:spore coat polysaccharide biosynthesis protein SpsF